MSSTRETDQKIHHFGEISKIVMSMKALAAMNVQQAQSVIEHTRAYENQIWAALSDLSPLLPDSFTRFSGQRTLIILFGSDQGLCGQFNDTLVQDLPKRAEAQYILVGKKLRERFAEPYLHQVQAPGDLKSIYTQANILLELLIPAFLSAEIEEIELRYHRLTQMGRYQTQNISVFPLAPRTTLRPPQAPMIDLPPQELLHGLLFEYLYLQIYQGFLEAFLTENSLRLVNMNQASHNIEEKIQALARESHYLHQEEITAEISEIISAYKVLTEEHQ